MAAGRRATLYNQHSGVFRSPTAWADQPLDQALGIRANNYFFAAPSGAPSTSVESLWRSAAHRSRSPLGTDLPATHIIPSTLQSRGNPGSKPRSHPHSWRFRAMDQRRRPFDWWTPTGAHGESFLNNSTLRSYRRRIQARSVQRGRILLSKRSERPARWYHDHAWASHASMLMRDRISLHHSGCL